MENHEITKIDSNILHFMFFVPTIKRKENFKIEKEYGKSIITIKANETLNGYDLITFAQVLSAFQSGQYTNAGNIEGNLIIRMDLDLHLMAKLRNATNKLSTRKSIFNSLKRLFSIKLFHPKCQDNFL